MSAARWRWLLFVIITVALSAVALRAALRFAARNPHAVANHHPADLPQWQDLKFPAQLQGEGVSQLIENARQEVLAQIQRAGAGIVRNDAMPHYADRVAARLAYVLSGDEEFAILEAKKDGAVRIGPAPGINPSDEERAQRWMVGWRGVPISVEQIVVRQLDLRTMEGNAAQSTRITGRSPLRAAYPPPPSDAITFETVVPCLVGPPDAAKVPAFLGIAYDWSTSSGKWFARDMVCYTHDTIIPVPPM